VLKRCKTAAPCRTRARSSIGKRSQKEGAALVDEPGLGRLNPTRPKRNVEAGRTTYLGMRGRWEISTYIPRCIVDEHTMGWYSVMSTRPPPDGLAVSASACTYSHEHCTLCHRAASRPHTPRENKYEVCGEYPLFPPHERRAHSLG
jgi:hypothetical protein